MNKCLNCQTETSNPKFCSRSCSASVNNQGIRRHGAERNKCLRCGKLTSSSRQRYCSNSCSRKHYSEQLSKSHHQKMNALRQSRYRAKKYRVLAENADPKKIKEIYLNCPEGYEVDHVVPLSKGGLHHENNLQYLPIKVNRSKGNRYSG